MRYAITGATGFVGGALAAELRRGGHHVVALVRAPTKAGTLAGIGVELAVGDLDDDAALQTLCHGADGVFHVAGWYRLGNRDRAEAVRVNVDGTRNVLAATAKAGTPRIVYTSTLAINSDTGGELVDEGYRFTGRHLSIYDETKAAAHWVAARFAAEGLPVITVMPGLVYGPGDTSQTGRLLHRVIEGYRPLVPDAGALCWGYVDDIAAGHLLAMERGTPGASYMLAGPAASLATGLGLAAEIAGTRGPITVPTWAVKAMARAAQVAGRVVPLPSGYALETLRASIATYLGIPAKSQKELGWSARSLREGLTTVVAAIRAAEPS
ncbi:MAG: NAD-dependent epimerase/dehydratase family protein [Actinomycetota bacterium]|nr:NAD-dependent epimerase/dehydratase family protein [Actinomycetota bacterium]